MIHHKGRNLRHSLFILGKLCSLLLIGLRNVLALSLADPSVWNILSCCLYLLLTLGAGWGLCAKKLTLGHNFPAKKSGHSGVFLRCCNVPGQGQDKGAVKEEKWCMGVLCVSRCVYPIKLNKGPSTSMLTYGRHKSSRTNIWPVFALARSSG